MYLKEPALVRNPSPQSIGLRAIPSRHGGCRVSLSGLNEIADIATAISAGVLILSFMATLHMHDQCHPNGLWCGRRDSTPTACAAGTSIQCAYQFRHARTWWAWRDLNPQPDRYERPALTIELQALVQGSMPDPRCSGYINRGIAGQVSGCLLIGSPPGECRAAFFPFRVQEH
jgi:hypothetical protein